MYRVLGLRLGPIVVVRLAAAKNFCLQLTAEKIRALAVFEDKYLQLYGCSDWNVTATATCTNPETEVQSGIVEIQIVGTKIGF